MFGFRMCPNEKGPEFVPGSIRHVANRAVRITSLGESQMQTTFTCDNRSSLSALLARYMNGQIAERSWTKLMRTFDLEGISCFERMAFARFMNDVLDDGQSERLNVPKPLEMEELLNDLKKARN